jgi:hypothetical protein
MSDAHPEVQQPRGELLQEVSNAMVVLHKEQFGRGRPERDRTWPARTRFCASWRMRSFRPSG